MVGRTLVRQGKTSKIEFLMFRFMHSAVTGP